MKVEVDADELASLRAEVRRLQAREQELIAHNTRLHDERIAWDRRHQVRAFHQKMGVPHPEGPRVPSAERVCVRVALLFEEFNELMNEIAIPVDRSALDLVAIAHELADLDYVIEGTRLEFGIDGTPIARLVHEANMRKDPPVDGSKAIKPEGWKPADVAGEIERQRRSA